MRRLPGGCAFSFLFFFFFKSVKQTSVNGNKHPWDILRELLLMLFLFKTLLLSSQAENPDPGPSKYLKNSLYRIFFFDGRNLRMP